MPYLILRDSIFQEHSSFAKECRKRGGFFKCCIQTAMLNTFETVRNNLIEEGLIKDKPTSWCKPGWGKKDPCFVCTTDAMCTELDNITGKIKQTFLGGFKKEQMVMRWCFYLIICFYRWGEHFKPLGRVGALDLLGARLGTCVM